MNEYFLSFDIEGVPQARPRVAKWGVYYPKKTADFKKLFTPMVKSAWADDPLEGALKVRIRFVMTRPKKPANEFPASDVDNLGKNVMDCANEIVWADDKQIVDCRITKEWGERSLIEIKITPIQLNSLNHPMFAEDF